MPEAPRPLLRNLLTALLFVGGIALLVGLAREIGIDPVIQHADSLIWFLPAATLLHILVHWANTLGWRYAIGAEAAKVPFLRLFFVWAAGDLVNWGTPGAVGGEFLRAHLIRDRVPMNVGIASVTVARLAQTMAQFAVIAIGLGIAWTRLDLGAKQRGFLVFLVGGALVFVVGVYLLQRTKLFGHATAAARGAGIRGRLFEKIETAFGRVDASMREYHRDFGHDFGYSCAFYFAGWSLQILEVPMILAALDAPIDWRAVVAIESLAILVESVAFLVPGKVGVDEGGRVLIFRALGYTSALGLGFSLFRRAREMIWFALCYVFMIVVKQRTDRALAEAAARG
jgi:glycosyltransferase 2 family protein